jgi:phosphoglycolate phosphatase
MTPQQPTPRRPARPIRGILFDKDGTLLDFHQTWQPLNDSAILLAARGDSALAQRLAAAGGIDPATGRARPDTLLAAAGTREIAAGFIAAGSPFELDELTAAIDVVFRAGVATAVPVGDLGGLMARLKQRALRIGIASSDSEAAIRATMSRFGFERHVDFVAGYDSGLGLKPGPGMLEAFARATGLPPAEIAVVGDNLHDMHMAERGGAGLRIAVLTGTGTRESLMKAADHCLESIAGLEALLFAEA